MYQKITVVGNLGRDPEMRYTPSGQAVCNFSVATSHSYTNSNGEKIKETTWFRVSAWGKLAETCALYLSKGSKILVEGRMNADKETGGPRIWKKQDGTPSASFEMTADKVVFLTKVEPTENAATEEEPAEEFSDDELPF